MPRGDGVTAISRPLLAFIGPVSYGMETRTGMRAGVVHAFRGTAQRDDWVSKEPSIRKQISTTDPKIPGAWDQFTIVLHPDTRTPWCPLV